MAGDEIETEGKGREAKIEKETGKKAVMACRRGWNNRKGKRAERGRRGSRNRKGDEEKRQSRLAAEANGIQSKGKI